MPPTNGIYYQWKDGDTLDSVANEFKANVDDIIGWPGNDIDLTNPTVEPGSWVMVPGGQRDFVQWLIPTIATGSSGTSNTSSSSCPGGAVGSGAFVWPADNHFLSGNDYWSGHLGIDIAAGEGAPVYAADAGVVTMAQGGDNYGYGNVIQIDHGNGYSTLYAHLSVIGVGVCQSVYAGQWIGSAGSTGNSTGAHLHFEVRRERRVHQSLVRSPVNTNLAGYSNLSGFLIPMSETQLEQYLSALPLSAFRYYDTLGSTNDEALAWASQGAPDFSLILADEQTNGRGRMNRKWFTPPRSALAMSLILRPTTIERAHPTRTTGLLALSLAESLLKLGLVPQIKWPNDVLLTGRKVAGILVETTWMGEDLDALILGMGVNVLNMSVPPAEQLLFPATSIETELGHPIERTEVLRDVLARVLDWRPKLGTDAFLKSWEGSLAFRGQQVQVQGGSEKPVMGELLGLETDGSLRLRDKHGKSVTVQFGEVHLRPLA